MGPWAWVATAVVIFLIVAVIDAWVMCIMFDRKPRSDDK